ncbi:MAG: Lrp/AsnC family transcriptional regulator [Rhodobacteraceae bacterium]|nr:Lrp/AsnC family transcriptional regulator [Paracoccaceae bacterium]
MIELSTERRGRPVNRNLDEIDRKLIAMLKANARESTAALARRLELSRSAVQERIARLERSGVIAGYTVRLGADVAQNRLQAIVRFTMDPKHTAGVVRELRKIPEADACYLVSGAFDLIVMVSAGSAARLHEVLSAFGNLRGVERTTSSVVLVNEFDNRAP